MRDPLFAARCGWLTMLLVLPGLVLALDERPTTLAAAGGNPLALSALAFLGWYWSMLAVLVGLSVVVRLLGWRVSAPAQPSAGLADDPYLMAYLAAGPQRVVETVMASLVQQGALRVNAVTRELIAEQELAASRPKIEQRARNVLHGAHHIPQAARFRRQLQRELHSSLAVMRQHLLNAGLLARPTVQLKALVVVKLGVAALLGVGVVRLLLGVAAGRDVGFLVVSLVLTLVLFNRLLKGLGNERATTQGTQMLEQCQRTQLKPGEDERLWMVALLGLAGYGMGPLADLHHVMQVSAAESLFGRQHSQGGDSGDASGGGDGGCGGGGCGGCGG